MERSMLGVEEVATDSDPRFDALRLVDELRRQNDEVGQTSLRSASMSKMACGLQDYFLQGC